MSYEEQKCAHVPHSSAVCDPRSRPPDMMPNESLLPGSPHHYVLTLVGGGGAAFPGRSGPPHLQYPHLGGGVSGCDLGEDRGSSQQGSSGFVDFLCWCHFLLPWLPYWLSLFYPLALFWAAFLLFIPTRDLMTSFFPDRCFIPEASHTYHILHSPQILMSCIFLFI